MLDRATKLDVSARLTRNAGTNTAELATRFDVTLGNNERLALDIELFAANALANGRETTIEPVTELVATRFDAKETRFTSAALATELCAANEEASGRSTASLAAGTLLNANKLENSGLSSGSIIDCPEKYRLAKYRFAKYFCAK